MHSQQPPGVVQNWSTLQCSKQNTEQCGYDHAPVTRGRMRAQFPLPHGPVVALIFIPAGGGTPPPWTTSLPPLDPLPPSQRRSRSSAVMHVTPELEVLGSNPGGVGTQCPRR